MDKWDKCFVKCWMSLLSVTQTTVSWRIR